MITYDLAHEYFEYKEGFLYWKKKPAKSTMVGDLVGHKDSKGYTRVGFMRKKLLVHRIIFLMHHGFLPEEVDHKDNDPSNNKIENLRKSDGITNQYNIPIWKSSTSGIKNVVWLKKSKLWRVSITLLSKTKVFGYYKDKELAELVSIEARNKYHGKFANHGNGYVPEVTFPFKGIAA